MAKTRITGKLYPIKDNVLVTGMNFGERKTSSGIVLPGDDMEQRGVRPRWARVVAVGPKQEFVKEGEWVLIAHGRWTRGFDLTDPETGNTETLRMIDPKDILMSADEEPSDDYVSDRLG